MRVLSLFSGCGGLDLGFLGGFSVLPESINPSKHPSWLINYNGNQNHVLLPETDFDIVFANDILKEAKVAYDNYFFEENEVSHFHHQSIVELVRLAEAGQYEFPNDIDVVIGGFPCQDFSVAGKRAGFKSKVSHMGFQDIEAATEENRGQLYMWMKRVIELVNPKLFVAENVKGLVSLGDARRIIQHDFEDMNNGFYIPEPQILHAGNYGVPQSRERVIFIGVNKEFVPNNREILRTNFYPEKTHWIKNSEAESDKNLLPYVPVIHYLQDLNEPINEVLDLSQQSYSRAKYYGTHVQGQTEIKPNGLGPTIRAEHHGNIEFRRLSKDHGGVQRNELEQGFQERRLSVRECARIQTFPDDFEFVFSNENGKVSASKAYKLIGNAVPPLLGYHIATRLQSIFEQMFEIPSSEESKANKERIRETTSSM